MCSRRSVVSWLLLLSGSVFCHAAPIDSGLFTTYTTDNAKTTLYWVVCGSIPPSEGCYSAGQLGPFAKIGSIVEGNKSYNKTTGAIMRHVYVIEQASGSGQNEVALHDYKRVDTIVGSYDTTTFTLARTVSLPLTGGSSALVFVGANNNYLVIGTSVTAIPVEVKKSTLAITSLNIISQIPISITADNYGFITVTSANGFFVVGPSGALQEDGGGSPFTVNKILGTRP